MYQLLFHPQTIKKLKQIHPLDKKRVLKKLSLLSKDPDNSSLDIKKLANTQNSYRLRTGDMRVIFERDSTKKIIYIWDIDYRGSIY